jgi:hypothetical protein
VSIVPLDSCWASGKSRQVCKVVLLIVHFHSLARTMSGRLVRADWLERVGQALLLAEGR